MKGLCFLLIGICILACSPYKKVVLTMSQQQTNRWKDATENAVLNELGTYKKKTPQTNGYSLLFDYTITTVSALAKNTGSGPYLQVTQFDSKQNPVLVPRNNIAPVPNPNAGRYNTDKAIKFMEFYFDTAHRVQYVYAEGYPDSVRYVKRN